MNSSELAKEMNVTVKDIDSLMNMVFNSMTQDGVTYELMSNMTELDRVEAVNAYVQSEVKKFSEFCVTLMTNQEKKSAFDQYLYHELKVS